MSFQTAAHQLVRTAAIRVGRGVFIGVVAVGMIVVGALLQIGVAWVVR